MLKRIASIASKTNIPRTMDEIAHYRKYLLIINANMIELHQNNFSTMSFAVRGFMGQL